VVELAAIVRTEDTAPLVEAFLELARGIG
jgi:hypothetical protein